MHLHDGRWLRQATDPVTDAPPSPDGVPAWETVKLSNAGTFDPPDATCLSDGVTFTRDDIGFGQCGCNGDFLAATNTLHANPHNNAGTQANGVKARFRIANWGTSTCRLRPRARVWLDIANSNGVPQPSGTNIPGNTVGSIQTDYTVNSTCRSAVRRLLQRQQGDVRCSCGGNNPATNNTRADHQCLLVDLTARACSSSTRARTKT